MESMLEKKQRVNLLMDCYIELLTDKQQNMLHYYYNDDWSLSEIADELSISRNAVFDTLKKAVLALEKYEDTLKLLDKHIERMNLIKKIEKQEDKDYKEINQYLTMLKEL